MKVALLYRNLEIGGIESVVTNIANNLQNNNHSVTLILFKKCGLHLTKINKNITILEVGNTNKLLSIYRIIKILVKNKFDILFTASPSFNIIGIICKYMANVSTKVVISEHTNTKTAFVYNKMSFYKLSFLFTPILYKYSNLAIAVSKGVANNLNNLSNVPLSKIKVINNPAFSEEFFKIADEKIDTDLFDDAIPVVVAVGRLVEAKNFSQLINAVELVLKSRKIKLIIIGDGPLKTSLMDQINDLQLNDSVFLTGSKENPISWIAKAHLFVLSSQWEGFGNVIVEALAVGRTIVATDCDYGPSEILCSGEFGYLVPNRQTSKLAEAIKHGLDNPMPKGPLIARARDFDVLKIMKSYESAFEGLLLN